MISENIEKLFKKHEDLKLKWLRLTEDDLFNWVILWESILDENTNCKSKYQEEKQQNDVEEWLRFIELQNEKIEIVDKKGEVTQKNRYTIDSAKAVLWQLFFEQRHNLQASKLIAELLQNKATVIWEYINIVKLTMRK